MTEVTDLTTVDLTDPDTQLRDLDPYWREVRDRMPLLRHPATAAGPAFWVVSRYADVSEIYRDDRQFSSERGNVLTTLLSGEDTAAGKMLAVTDAPRHTQLRNVLLRAFSPRVLDLVSERVRANTRSAVSAAVEAGTCDFATEVAEHIPMGTICDLLGVPAEDRPYLLELNKSALSSDDDDAEDGDAWGARGEILLYFTELAEARRAEPRDDVVTALATAVIDGKPLSLNEIIFNCYSLILGGDETSRLSMIGAIQAFLDHPDQWRALRSGDVGLDTAVEEVLRWTTPAVHFGRTALAPVTLHGHTIQAGDVVTLWNTSANRDERAFAEPARFDLARTPNKHLTFARGRHFCIGAHLARVELGAVLDSLRTLVAEITPAGPSRRIRSNLLTGYSRMPVTLSPSGPGSSA